jgi:hypothetical protein
VPARTYSIHPSRRDLPPPATVPLAPFPHMPIPRILAEIRALAQRLVSGSAETAGERPPRLWSCPNTQPVRSSAQIGAAGGQLRIGDHYLDVPPGAVADSVDFTGEVLADAEHLKVDIRANGEDSFAFSAPVSLTLSYAGCTGPGNAPPPSLILKIHRNGKVESVGGRPDPQRQTVTTTLRSLSLYTLGIPA